MSSLIIPVCLFLFLWIPRGLFYTFFRLFLRKYSPRSEFTTLEELLFAVEIILVPALLAVCCIFLFWRDPSTDYRLLVTEIFRDSFNPSDSFWNVASHVLTHIAYASCVFYAAVILDAASRGFLCSKYALIRYKYQTCCWFPAFEFYAKRFLLNNLSQWDLLLSNLLFYKADIFLDVLTEDDHLYTGEVGDYFTDKSAELSGILLASAKRFRREDYKKDKQAGKVSPDDYWEQIPGHSLYISADKICNLNIRYKTLPPLKELKERIMREAEQIAGGKKWSIEINI